jgi:tetratricopeptide (TPR) repeat protein
LNSETSAKALEVSPGERHAKRSVLSAPRAVLVALVVFTLTAAVYIPGLSAPFVWDDHYLILKSPRVTELQPLGEYFGSAFWTKGDVDPIGRNYYRPLTILSLALDHYIHGNNAGGYHLTNIVLHALNGALLFALLRRKGLNAWVAGLLAAAWAWFPRLTEAAAWISGRTDVLAGTFVLLALLFTPAKRAPARWLVATSLLMGLWAKEVAMAGVAAVAFLEWNATRAKPLRERLLALAPVGAAFAAYTGFRLVVIGSGLQSNALPPLTRALCALDALGRYAWMTLDGWHASIQIGYLGDYKAPFIALGLLVILASTALFVRFGRRFATDTWAAIILTCVSLALVLHIAPITVNVMAADRFLYLPVAGLVLALAPLFRDAGSRRALVAGLALVALSYAPATFARTKDWCDEIDFWMAAFRDQKGEHNATSRLELGNVYNRAGLHYYARAVYLDAKPERALNYAIVLNNVAMRLAADGDAKAAVAVLQRVLELAPEVPRFHFGMAIALIADDRLDDAERELERGAKLNPDSPSKAELTEVIKDQRGRLGRPRPDTSTTLGKLEEASRLGRQYRSVPALDVLVEAAKAPDMPRGARLSALLYAFEVGSPKQLRQLYDAYRKGGGSAPEIDENYRMRMEQVTRLKALWPTLAAHRTDMDPAETGPLERLPR